MQLSEMNKKQASTLPLPEHNVHPVYRPDIDGLRSVAILSVVIYHAFPARLRGGFVGVDIFFVISGFLISTIIFRSMQRGDFSFTEFYAHRVKRIFPALIVVLLSAYIFGWFALLPEEFKQLGKHIAAGAGFVQNFTLWQEAGYFDTASEVKPLMHLWSLAIEEQFYLVYPLIIWAVWRLGLNILSLVLIFAGVSFGLNISNIGVDAVSTFFLPQTRFWELLAGSVLAYLQFFKRMQFTDWMKRCLFHPLIFRYPPVGARREAVLNDALSVLGSALIIFAIFSVNEEKLFPGWWALAPVFGAFFLILAGPEAWINRKVLANRLMVFVGLISYPLYLWHWPIFSYLRIVESGIPSRELRIAAVFLSFVLAWVTYRFIERPIRFGAKGNIKTLILVLLTILIGSLGYYTYYKGGFPSRINQAMTEEELLTERGRYWGHSAQTGTPFAEGKQNIIVFGDSQAHDILHALKSDTRIGLKLFETAHYCSAFFSPDIGSENTAGDGCQKSYDSLINSEEIKRADVLIYAHQWRPGAEVEANYAKGIDRIRLLNKNIKVYFFGPKQYLSPTGSINVIVKNSPNLWGMNEFISSKVSTDNDNAYVAYLAKQNNAFFVDVRNIFCIDGCLFYGGGKYSYFDSSHWTQSGADRFFDNLRKTDLYQAMVRR